jgi:hypothetical protein
MLPAQSFTNFYSFVRIKKHIEVALELISPCLLMNCILDRCAVYEYSHGNGIVCRVCRSKLECDAEKLAHHCNERHNCFQASLSISDVGQFAGRVSDLSKDGTKTIHKGFHCYQCERVAKKKANLNRLHSDAELSSGCTKRDISECLLLEDSLGRLSLHLGPKVNYFQSQDPLWLPDIFGTKKEVEKSITKPTFRERLRRKITQFCLRARSYKIRRGKANIYFGTGKRHYVPFTFYKQVRKDTDTDTNNNNEAYVYGSPYCPSVDDIDGLPTPDSTAPKIIDMTYKQELNLEIHLGDLIFTTVKIVNASSRTGIIDAVVRLGNAAAANTKFKDGHVRKRKDLGRMYGFGFNWKNKDFYPTCRDPATQEIMKDVASHATDLLLEYFPSELHEIIAAESDEGRDPIEILGLIGSKIMLSVNLVNASHLDVNDKSRSVAIWVESVPGSTENWYFILPNVSFRGSCGVAIKLFHGCMICWDATALYHCSTFSTNMQGGHAYGCMFGSCVGTNDAEAE